MNDGIFYAFSSTITNTISDLIYNYKIVDKNISYEDYSIVSNTISFIGAALFYFLYKKSNISYKKLDNEALMYIILLNILGYLISSPLAYMAYQKSNDKDIIKSILNLNIIFFMVYSGNFSKNKTIALLLLTSGFVLMAYK